MPFPPLGRPRCPMIFHLQGRTAVRLYKNIAVTGSPYPFRTRSRKTMSRARKSPERWNS